MKSSKKLSLLSAILININVMLGSGIFINTVVLAKEAGSLSPLSYIIVGILLLPIVFSIVTLWGFCKSQATFYQLAGQISPFMGFLSSWGYFIGKISTFSLGIHVCSSILHQLFDFFKVVPLLLLDLIFIFVFTVFNLLNLKVNSKIQYGFIILKFIPILFMIFSVFYLFSYSNFGSSLLIPQGIPVSLTLVFYAFSGFESSCSLSQLIDNPKKNGVKAILISYLLVIIIATLFQFSFCSIFMNDVNFLSEGYLCVFGSLVSKLFIFKDRFKSILISILNLGIAFSSIGSAYGVMFSNSWNLYTLAQNEHLFFSKFINRLNKDQVPYICIIIEGIIAIMYILLSQGYQISLQQVAALASTIAYTLSVLALLFLSIRQKIIKNIYLAFVALCSCLILIIAFVSNLFFYGISNLLILFLLFILFGGYMFYRKHRLLKLEIYEEI